VPLTSWRAGRVPIGIDGAVPDATAAPVDFIVASPRYFDVLGITVRHGRAFSTLDRRGGQQVAIVNRTMARQWAGRDPIGSQVILGTAQPPRVFTVVGVVDDVRQYELDRDALPHVYVPLSQSPFFFYAQFVVRTEGDPAALAPAVRDAARALDPWLPVERLRTLTDVRREHLANRRLTARLLVLLAGLALVVTTLGVATAVARLVAARTPELAVRVALGAGRTDVVGVVVRECAAAVGLGLVAGVTIVRWAAPALSDQLASLLYRTAPADPAVLGGVAALLAVAAALAAIPPVRRALGLDSLAALRAE
jgi:ABC-type antimicrobial peptide transport system permease subunit